MSLTISGPFLLALALLVAIRRPLHLSAWIVFFAPFSATAIVNLGAVGYKSGGLGFTPASAFLLLFFAERVLTFAFARPARVSGGLLLQVGLVGALLAVSLASGAAAFGRGISNSLQVTQLVYVALGWVATIALAFEFCRPGLTERAIAAARAAAVFVSAWGFFQVACFYAHVPYPAFLFNNSHSDAADMFNQAGDGIMRMASVAVEPSFFAASMLHFVSFGLTILLLEPRLRTRAWILPVGFATIAVIACTSSTGYLGLATLAILLLIRSPLNTIALGVPALLAGALAVLLVPNAWHILLSFTVDKGASSSFDERTTGAADALATFNVHPLIGGGWGSVGDYSAVTATLGSVGLIGTVLFVLAAIATLHELQSRRRDNLGGAHWRFAAYAAGIQNALIVAFVCALSSGIKYVVLDDACFWALGIAVAAQLPYGPAHARRPRPTASSRLAFSALEQNPC